MSGSSVRRHKLGGQVCRPEPFVGKSFVESVTGFIQEVAPQTTGAAVQYEDREKVMWVKFDNCDLTDYSLCKTLHLGTNPPLLLIIGYAKGLQVWIIPEGGAAVELLSYRQGPVKCFKILRTPDLTDLSDICSKLVDEHSLKRPLAAICDSSSNYQTVVFQSLRTGEQIKAMKFAVPVQELYANQKVLVVAFPADLAVFNTTALEELFKVSRCYPVASDCLNPVALGSSWMAFADNKLYSGHHSKGGVFSEIGATYKTTVFHAAKSITKGLLGFGESMASNFMGQTGSPSSVPSTPRASPGIVTIVDIGKVKCSEFSLQNGDVTGLVSHFEAHQGSPLAVMEFDASGLLLATADQNGYTFHVFKINPNDLCLNVVQHLYTLKRGDTTARIMNITFSVDSRYVSVSTHRGTAHVFPMTPYGGNIEARTHLSTRVVNRLSKYQRSVGIKESEAGYTIPSRTASPIAKYLVEPPVAAVPSQYACYGPVVVEPLVQIKQAVLQNLFGTLSKHSPSSSPPADSRVPGRHPDDVKIACVFGSRRSHLDGVVSSVSASKAAQPYADALFVAGQDGVVVEYDLRPKVATRMPVEKRAEDNPIELDAEPVAQWTLLRELGSKEIRPTLHPGSILLTRLPEARQITSDQEEPTNKEVEEQWESQVECLSYVGPNRRLWMGPQFNFLPESKMTADTQQEFLPEDGSSPTFVNVSSLSASDQSNRFGCSFDSESEEYINKVKSQLADAMLDYDIDYQSPPYNSSLNYPRQHKTDPDDDVLDISVGPVSTSRSGLRPPSTTREVVHKPRVEAEYQDITKKLEKVGITSVRTGKDNHPLWGAHTPSLDECRAMTSSAEELSATLTNSNVESSFHNDWQPIDPPVAQQQRNHTLLERPKPLDIRGQDALVSASSSSMEIDPLIGEEAKTTLSCQSVSAWSKVTETKCHLLENEFGPSNMMDPSSVQSPKEFSSKSFSSSSAKSSSLKSSATSANTSEDDFTSREVKNGRKKKKKKMTTKMDYEREEAATLLVDTNEVQVGASSQADDLMSVDDIGGFDMGEMVELEIDNFHSAKEYHDAQGEDFQDPGETEEYSSFNQLDDMAMASDEDEIAPVSGVGILSSIHDDDDLAKALEEASSDDSRPVCSCTMPANEMFPFRDASSDDEGHVIRRRAPLQFYPEDDDRDTTSGDDRKTTSESDVTTSPNPHAASTIIRGKKKKKKRK